MRVLLAVVALTLLAFSPLARPAGENDGIAAASDDGAQAPPPAQPTLSMGNMTVTGDAPILWQGPVMPEREEDRRSFELTVPDGFWNGKAGGVAVAIEWPKVPPSPYAVLELHVYDAAGDLVAEGKRGNWGGTPSSGVTEYHVRPLGYEAGAIIGEATGNWAYAYDSAAGFAIVALMDRPSSGQFTLAVTAGFESVPYEGALHVQYRSVEPARDLLPNLVSLPPFELRLGCNNGVNPDTPTVPLAARCLRFGILVGNIGDGPLEMRLSLPEGAQALAGDGQVMQRIQRTDGTFRDAQVGSAVFHAAHHHFHYAGADVIALHEYDTMAGARGPQVGGLTKLGVCYADLLLAAPGLTWTGEPRYDGIACHDPTVHVEWVAGLSQNWVDVYPSGFPDQYVEISGLPDGTYELVARANGDGATLESTDADNEASTIFRLTGNSIEVLGATSPVPAWSVRP